MTADCNSRYCYLDPRTGGKIAVAEAARNLVSSGARPMALTDCLNFGNPERPEVMWQLIEAIEGIKEACHALGVPVVSGNVSLYNETSGTSVHPTPTIGMVGLIEDLANHTRQWFLEEGDLVALLGTNVSSIGGSEYLSVVHKMEKGLPPAIDLVKEKAVQDACLKGVKAGIIVSAHDVSEGGLAVALAEACMNPDGPIGAEVELDANGLRSDDLLFGEAQSRIVVSLKLGDLDALKAVAKEAGAPLSVIGKVGGRSLKVNGLIDLAGRQDNRRVEKGSRRLYALLTTVPSLRGAAFATKQSPD